MKREVVITADGSPTVEIPSMGVTYHSRHGAITESLHVFIDAGLKYWNEQNRGECSILEMGFGTGLNALLTLMEAEKLQRRILYTAIEPFPLEEEIVHQLNYIPERKNTFLPLHSCEWEKEIAMSPFFTFKKCNTSLTAFSSPQNFDVIYYDAFAPNAQPELWTQEIFEKLYRMLAPAGLLVTYCSKGEVQRAMKSVGFKVEKLAGPPGKREMLRGRRE